MTVMPGAEPFSAEGGPTGVVLCHGFTGTPQSMRPWAEHLAAAGHTVRVPRLPGHGTRWQDMNSTPWTAWFGELERAFTDLRGRCEQVFACGLSMGGALVLRLAETHPDEVAGLVLVNPAVHSYRRDLALLPVLAKVVASRPGIASDIRKPGVTELAYDRTPVGGAYEMTKLWKAVRADLGAVTAPTLVFRSRTDHVVDGRTAEVLRRGLRPGRWEERVLDNSFHVATLDHDAPVVFDGTVEWIGRYGGRSSPPSLSPDPGSGLASSVGESSTGTSDVAG